MDLKLKVWRQAGPNAPGRVRDYDAPDVSPDMSFLELLDVVNEQLLADGKEPIAFDHDCREGICGSCSMMINGQAHGPERGTATCQLHLRKFEDGDHDHGRAVAGARRSRSSRTSSSTAAAFDRIIEAGGYITAPTGSAPDANLIPVPKEAADASMDAAACIGCGACVAACPNGAAQLFTSAKLAHLNLMPQGQAERWTRTVVDGRDDGDATSARARTTGVRGRVPEGDQHRLHRADEPRLREGAVQEPQAQRPTGLTIRRSLRRPPICRPQLSAAQDTCTAAASDAALIW